MAFAARQGPLPLELLAHDSQLVELTGHVGDEFVDLGEQQGAP